MNTLISNKRSVEDLFRIAQPATQDQHQTLRKFSAHYHANTEVVPFLLSRSREQVRKFGWVCFDTVWGAALMELRLPGGPDFKLPAKLKAWYVRAVIYCHSDLNGSLTVRFCAPDSVFGMAVANKLPSDYAGRLTCGATGGLSPNPRRPR
jgi:hypothetical protein